MTPGFLDLNVMIADHDQAKEIVCNLFRHIKDPSKLPRRMTYKILDRVLPELRKFNSMWVMVSTTNKIHEAPPIL
jgi:hypothetical protein